jgi:hypothetical protein
MVFAFSSPYWLTGIINGVDKAMTGAEKAKDWVSGIRIRKQEGGLFIGIMRKDNSSDKGGE